MLPMNGRTSVATNEPPLDEAELEGLDRDDDSAGRPDPAGGGCMRLGWGCLPVLVGGMVLVPGLLL